MDYDHNAHATPATHREVIVDRWDSREEIHQYALYYKNQLEGWCSDQKASILVDLVLKTKPEVIVEIGVFGGKSLVPMAYALKMNQRGIIYGIDPWETQASVEGLTGKDNIDYWNLVDHKGIMNGLIRKIFEFDLANQIELIELTSAETPPIENIDILHVDGNHTSDASYYDVVKWVPYVKKGGWIIFDDITWCEDGVNTTAKAVHWLNEHCVKFAEFSDSCVWGIWVKK